MDPKCYLRIPTPPPPAKARAKIALIHGASTSTPQYHNVASVAAASVTMDTANAFGLAGAVHAVSTAFAGSNSTVPLDQFYWICLACSYTNEEDISRAVFGNTDEGSHVCVICQTTSSSRSSKDVDSEVKDKILDSLK